MKKLFTILGLSITVITHSQNNCQMSGWQYVKTVTINNTSNSNNLTAFQLNLTFDTQTLISQGKMNIDGSDIRFTSSSCLELNYWIEKGINSSSTSIWVKLNSIQGNTSDSIFMYYGNSLATPVSNGDSTFIAFDDFDDNSISSAWSIENANWVESAGVLTSSGNGSYTYPTIFRTDLNSVSSFYIHYYFKWSNTPGTAAGGWFSTQMNKQPYYDLQMRNSNEYSFSSSQSGNLFTASWPHNTNWHSHDIYRDESGLWKIWLNGSLQGSATNNDIPVIDTLRFTGPSNGWGFNANLSIDSFYVAKYTSPLPTNLVGNEFLYSYSSDTCTVSIYDTIPIYDTTFVTVYDTIPVYDTTFVTVNDTVPVYDTTFVTINDTVPVYDTTFVTVSDTIPIYDTTVVTVNDTILIYDTTFVTINDTNYVTVYDSIAVTDTLIIDVSTGLNPPNNINTIKVYPNPAKTHISINCGNISLMNNYSIKITNSLGQIVFQSPVNQQQFYVDLSGWTGNGTYFVYIIDPQQNAVDIKKIILQ